MGKDRFLVAHTSDTLLVGDLNENKLSEVSSTYFSNKGDKKQIAIKNFIITLEICKLNVCQN